MEQLAEKSAEDLLLPSEGTAIPDKLYFRTGEVARLVSLKPYVLRFWETEFPTLMPKKSNTGHRLYRRKDVETVLEIKHLLYDKRFTIEGARKMLEARRRENRKPLVQGERQPRAQGELFQTPSCVLTDLRRELRDILELLEAH